MNTLNFSCGSAWSHSRNPVIIGLKSGIRSKGEYTATVFVSVGSPGKLFSAGETVANLEIC